MRALEKLLVYGHEETRVQILGEAVCISHRANTIGESMHQAILHLAMGK